MDRKKNQYGADIIAVLLQKIAVNCGQDLPPLHLTETGDPGQHEWLLRRKAFLDRRRNLYFGMMRAVVKMSNRVLTEFPCFIECLQIF